MKILKKTAIVLLGVILTYSFADSLKSYGSDEPIKGKIIYYDMPYCRVPTGKAFGGRFVSSFFKYHGKNDGRAPFGHAGLIVEDNKGNLTLYQYGRFHNGIGAVLPSSKRNWQKKSLGKRGNRSDKELINHLAPSILSGLTKSGNRINAYIMSVDDITPTVNYIMEDANNRNRPRYSLFTDNTCGGTARDAFDRSRCFPSRFINKWADIVNNVIPMPANVWSALTSMLLLDAF